MDVTLTLEGVRGQMSLCVTTFVTETVASNLSKLKKILRKKREMLYFFWLGNIFEKYTDCLHCTSDRLWQAVQLIKDSFVLYINIAFNIGLNYKGN